MSERNYWNQSHKDQHLRLDIDYDIDQCDKESAAFSQNLPSTDGTSREELEDFNAHVITRMPDLTGLSGDSDSQNISLYRAKSGIARWSLKWGALSKISMQKWCASLAIAIIAIIVVWSVFRNPSERLEIVGNEKSNAGQKTDLSPEWNHRQDPSPFGVPQAMNDSHFTSENRAEPFPVRGDSYFSFDTTSGPGNPGMFSQGPAHAETTAPSHAGNSYFAANIPEAAMVTPDSQSNNIQPWDRHPNTGTTQGLQPQFDFAAAQPNQNQPFNNQAYQNQLNGYQISAAGPQAGMGDPMTGYSSSQQNFSGIPPYTQQPQPGNVQPNMQIGYAQQNMGFSDMPNSVAPFGRETVATQGGMPNPPYPQQQVHYMQSPPNHENAIAVNPHAMPSYGQTQPGPQPNQAYNSMNYHTMPNNGGNPQPTYMSGQQPVAQANYSNVPVAASDRSFRDQSPIMNGTNGLNTPANPQNGFPYDNTNMSQSPDYYR